MSTWDEIWSAVPPQRPAAAATCTPRTDAAPFIAIWIHREGVPNYATHYRLLAAAVDKTWRETTKQPLRYLGSYTSIINGVSFYLPGRVSTLDIVGPWGTPWADEASVARVGIALVCPEQEAICMHFLNQRPELRSKNIQGCCDRSSRIVRANRNNDF